MKKYSADLPDKMSALILLALEDLEKAEVSHDYEVNMDEWHNAQDYSKCNVCLGGAVLAFSANYPADKDCFFADVDKELSKKMTALSELRLGLIHCASITLKLDLTADQSLKIQDFESDGMFEYDDNHDLKKYMRKMAAFLKSIGL